ncbi:MAG: NAD-dependent epimerase/dehydratase family protein [Pseudomonadota bacterium]
MRTAFVTGTAGFIGFHVARRLLAEGWQVGGFDGMTDYYDLALKRRRHALLAEMPGFTAHEARLEDSAALTSAIEATAPDVVIHLAAQAGVRYSLEAPRAYIDSNITGTFNLLEALRDYPPAHLLMASTSSVYGADPAMPYREGVPADRPLSVYAATKRAAEVLAHSYAHLWSLPVTMFRFFTVYGPWGRPDMALYKFVRATLAGEAIDVYNHGEMRRDFTYVDDLVEAIYRLIDVVPGVGAPVPGDTLSPEAPFRIVNIGNGQPVLLTDFIAAISAALGRPVRQRKLPMQPGDVPATWADTALLTALTGYAPGTDLRTGVQAFVDWYGDYHGVAPADAAPRGT